MCHNDTVTVTVDQKNFHIKRGTVLSQCLQNMDHPCGGHGKCGKCKIIAHGALSPISPSEQQRLSPEEIRCGVRLACCTTVEGDCEIVTAILQGYEKEKIITDGTMPAFVPDPSFSRYGVAFDIGTTTLAARLYSPSGKMLAQESRRNPQAVLGADVISRIEASLRGETERLAKLIIRAIDEMILLLASQANIDPLEIDGAVITGNTAMLYFLTATSPKALSHAPFDADRLFGETLSASALGLQSLAPNAHIYLPPCIAAFVGADTVCAILSTRLCEASEPSLLADIGTNGEMALWCNGTLSVCSTAAGPAFEGVGISMGMQGANGAIDRVRLTETGHLDVHVIGDTKPIGICGSGLVDAVACLLEADQIDETGYTEEDELTVSAPVILTDKDIRMLQLAKSAICAGLLTLLKTADISASNISALHIAGGFGSYLNKINAARIGLIPAQLTEKATAVGNAALAGASMLLLNNAYRAECACFAQHANTIELSSNPLFSELYMTGMTLEAIDW